MQPVRLNSLTILLVTWVSILTSKAEQLMPATLAFCNKELKDSMEYCMKGSYSASSCGGTEASADLDALTKQCQKCETCLRKANSCLIDELSEREKYDCPIIKSYVKTLRRKAK